MSARPLLGKLRPRVPLPLRMGLSLFCDMNCPFLDSNLQRREAKRVGEYAGHLRKREAGCLFRKVELKIERGHSTVAWTLQTLGFVPLFLFSAFLVSLSPFPLCYKGAGLHAASRLGCNPFNMPRELDEKITKASRSSLSL